MRKFRTRKGPPPQKNRALIQAMREAAALAAGKPQPPIPVDAVNITLDLPPLEPKEESDAVSEA